MESATIQIDTAFPGATQDVMQGFVTTPIVQAIASASGIEYITSTSSQGTSQIKAKLVLNANSDRAMTEILAKVQQVKYRLPTGAADPVITKITDAELRPCEYVAFVSDTLPIPQLTDFIDPRGSAVDHVRSGRRIRRYPRRPEAGHAHLGRSGQARGAGPDRRGSRLVLRANNVQAAPGQLKGAETAINITAATDLRSAAEFRQIVIKRDAYRHRAARRRGDGRARRRELRL